MSTLVCINSSLAVYMCIDCGEHGVPFDHYCGPEDDEQDADS